ncbi:VCBS repeat-containing protein [Flavitalea sp. BT771]|uniref:VCBS repeat-containing protein n=1 Tax=Flavitalea sp. BT771 TaxID=3063329 RepID=UPI0026E45737|nr:VCBS repeat-containing protein [Flavitalea sp. BT771]MDO6432048.1 VCBS repeat-containing protein [Flavitalea sp. BT771]MDV6220957.1 VCBS repeat-containing protein [Flavitalea sp. BT771]
MTQIARNTVSLICLTFFTLLQGCRNGEKKPVKDPLFTVMDKASTGLDFSNTLRPTKEFNVFDYMYFYNGGGIGAADLNNDGMTDLFFAANQGNNRLYLNQGNMHFRDITAAAGIPQDKGWSTGVSVVDINNDGLEDIYVCRVGQLEGLPSTHNQLLICTRIDSSGIPHYEDRSKQYGLDFSGFSTQAAFFDYDGDGDLDMYLLNHSIHQNGTFGYRQQKLATTSAVSGDRMYRNDGNGHFSDVTSLCGINSSIIGYGLGLTVSDIDLDGYPDIYVSNDFHENDYLYINQHNGKFREELNDHLMHTSQYSMGVDVADVNNDAYPEIISMDMLPYDPYILKRSEGEDTWDTYNLKLRYGYNHQYTRNNLQLNRRNGQFSEIGLYAGVAATDWSWSALWVDFDNDGWKDLFISNGIPKRLNDIDYINFVSNQELHERIQQGNLDNKDMEMIDKFPQIRLPSKFYRNQGAMQFADMADRIQGALPSFSNGAVYADLDNDGDLDLVVNTIDAPVILYRNMSNEKKKVASVDIRLQGPATNVRALGAKVLLFANNGIRSYEKYPVRGFMSSMDIPLHIGLGETKVDSAFLIWPDHSFQRISWQQTDSVISLSYHTGLPLFDYTILSSYWKNPTRPVRDITASTGLAWKHKENDFHEFDREPLIPHMLSTEGPALAVGDMNADGLQDLFFGSSKWEKSIVLLQDRSGKFLRMPQPDLEKDSTFEDVDACWIDVDKDGHNDLVVASGGNEFYGQDSMLSPRVYRGDGHGHLQRLPGAFDNLYINASCITPFDFNGDGYPDLFIGGRSIPFQYGSTPASCLLLNDGKGHFNDVTDKYAPGLRQIGFVTNAVWTDLDKDGQKDLVLSLEWGGIVSFMNKNGAFTKRQLTDKTGWWNFVLPVDIDNDGDIDIVAGNLGLNSRLHASEKEPVRLYYYDFDGNNKKEQILTYYLDGRELPFANKDELQKQLPTLKKDFLYAEDFAKAGLPDLFSQDKLRKADTLNANYFSNAILINDGHLNFTVKALPWEAQLSPYRDAVVVDANGDDLPDILMVGNFYDNNIQMGRYDADFGTILLNRGNDSLAPFPLNGVSIRGQSRHIRSLDIAGKPAFVIARNDDSARIIRFQP